VPSMGLTIEEKNLLRKIEEWKNREWANAANDFNQTYDQWIDEAFSLLPDPIRKKWSDRLDEWFLLLQLAIQERRAFTDRLNKIIDEARMMDPNVETVSDMKKLPISVGNFLADRQIATHRMYTLFQGGLTGSGKNLFLFADIPVLYFLNMRAVLLIAASYGFDPKSPFETVLALRVFLASTLPKRFQSRLWEELLEEVREGNFPYFTDDPEPFGGEKWLNPLISQLWKMAAIRLFRKDRTEQIPVFSLAIGMGWNYAFSKKVTEFARKFYQYRRLMEKIGGDPAAHLS
jgi:hypothetical protein